MITAAQDACEYDAWVDTLCDEPVDEPEPSDTSRLYALLDASLDYCAETIIWCDRDDHDTSTAVARWFDAQLLEHDDLTIQLLPATDKAPMTMIVMQGNDRIVTLYIR